MKVLIVGNGNHQSIHSYVEWLKNGGNYDFDIFSVTKVTNENKIKFHRIYNIKISKAQYYFYKLLGKDINTLKKRLYLKYIFEIPNLYYDIIHFHFFEKDILLFYNEIFEKSQNCIVSFWGSDIYKTPFKNNYDKKIYNDVLFKSNIITLWEGIENLYLNKFLLYREKLRFPVFGSNILDEMLKNKKIKKEIKTELNISEDKIVITIAYNAHKDQNHMSILNRLNLLSNKLKNRIYLFFPLTYPKNKQTKNLTLEIKTFCEKNNLLYKIFSEFLSENDIIRLRNCSDIYIHARETDAFSSSLAEYLFCENIVIIGDWLNYELIDKNAIFYIKLHSIKDLNNIIEKILNNIDLYKSKVVLNKNKIYNLKSWKHNIRGWIGIYQELVSNK